VAEGIVILGVPRSGTTLVRRLLDAHPNIACPGETNLFRGAAQFLKSEQINSGMEIGVISGLNYAGIEQEVFIQRLWEFIAQFLDEYATAQGKERWAEKTAFNAFHIPQIETLCADRVKYLCIIRHGLDVACSIEELCRANGIYLHELHEYVTRHPRPLVAFAHVWVDLTENILDFAQRHKERTLLFSYEDLTDDTENTIRKIGNFLDEEWPPGLVEKAMSGTEGIGLGDWKTYARKTIDSSSVGRWKNLPPKMISQLAAIVNTTLVKCGYQPIESTTQENEADMQRRYELGLLIGRLGQPD